MFDIITFGSATYDIYLKSPKFAPFSAKGFVAGQGMCLPAGSKIEVEGVSIFSGGGGTNAAATFKNQGFKTAYCGMVGDDFCGDLVMQDLKKRGIDVSLMKKTQEKATNLSVFLTQPGKDRTILVYRGASDIFTKKDISWTKIKSTKWVYLAPFGGKLAGLTDDLVRFAKKNNIKVALNPGYNQLTLPHKVLAGILAKIDILILNREEASRLTGIPYRKEKEIFKEIDKLCPAIAIMTKGAEGVVISDGQYLYRAPSLGTKVLDNTGAGDAFGAGFVSGMMQKNNIVFAIQLAMANSGQNLTKWGAKDGLLKKNESWPKVKVSKEKCL